MKTIKLLALFITTSLVFTACSDDHDDHDHDHEEELITTVIYTLTDGNNTVTLQWEDLDGDTGNAPVITDGILSANTTYTGSIQLLNKTETPAEDITVEVKTEGDEHEFFYSSSVSGVTINKTDVDGNDNPLGIKTTLTTGNTGTGSLTIVLKHEPTKPNNGTADNAGGSTDLEVTFNISVQ
ncbi:type 1 periplasmic binding fold superfamily protein [Polaribacter aestuariivivens]|uniref:Type 1 periplasmic binding fold superfamily protein n=1 Tax=Polaribacter aestuariivivens TaxID=2304626 RepID=A0A5S3N7Q1_9FLAO|nr:type 1 periplasmic binding fold superfamily protein [Polaribacter aestuariivivens]TMM31418.1 type 1 periplasmic binding fold superfamily protein [Polaribacter aestuariivivens]